MTNRQHDVSTSLLRVPRITSGCRITLILSVVKSPYPQPASAVHYFVCIYTVTVCESPPCDFFDVLMIHLPANKAIDRCTVRSRQHPHHKGKVKAASSMASSVFPPTMNTITRVITDPNYVGCYVLGLSRGHEPLAVSQADNNQIAVNRGNSEGTTGTFMKQLMDAPTWHGQSPGPLLVRELM